MEYIALNSHKRYSFASIQNLDGKIRLEAHVEHHPRCDPGNARSV
jgi:hypothetical protein